MGFLRRANLDAFWAREPRTVAGNLRETMSNLAIGREFGIPVMPALGPWDIEYDHGTANSICVLANSLKAGSGEGNRKKHSSSRKARTPYTNAWKASQQGARNTQVWRSEKRRMLSSTCPTDTEWYDRFMSGLKYRTGDSVRQDVAIPHEVMHCLMNKFEEDRMDAEKEKRWTDLRYIIESGTFAILTYCASLRGFETPKIILTYLRDFRIRDQQGSIAPHIGLPMSGRFKLRGNMDQNLLLFVAAETKSGLKPMKWVDHLIELLEKSDIRTGWLFQDKNGNQLKMSHFEEGVMDRLVQIQREEVGLIDPQMDVYESYGLARSFRQGATTRATNMSVKADDIDYINRWMSEAGKPEPYFSGNMRNHYADQRQMTETYLRFSLAL